MRELSLGLLLAAGALAGAARAAPPTAPALPPQPVWWTPNAGLGRPPASLGLGAPDGDFAQRLTGWTVLGPGKVDVRGGGPGGAYAALRDNSTLVSAAFTPVRGTQVLTVWLRALQGHAALRVLGQVDGRAEPLLLGTIEPGKSWSEHAVNARLLAGHQVRLVLDPVIALGDGIDVALAGRPEQPAPGFTVSGGAVLRSHGGPSGTYLGAEPGPLSLAGSALRIAGDAVTASVWVRAAPNTNPDVQLLAGAHLLGTTTAGPTWQPLRVPVASLRRRAVRLAVRSTDATGLQIAWIGTVQRAPSLRLLAARREPGGKRVRVKVAASQALARQRVRLERAVGNGWALVTYVRLQTDGTALAHLRLRGKPFLRASFDGSESVAPGVSAPRKVKPVAAP